MKQFIFILSVVLLFDLAFTKCANPQPPQGGPKDTIPPTLLDATPQSGTIDFKDQTVQLTFSEDINADKLNQNLIITPKTDVRFKHIVKRDQLIIKFEEPFKDSTTYSLNFFDGVTDITEKNPAINLTIAFSTGDFIDSAKVSGSIRDLFTQKPSEKFIVGLYPNTDTLDFFSQNPMYFTAANDSGEFNIGYIKNGAYRILAFNDDNRNLIFDPDTEDHGFTVDTLNLTDSIGGIQLWSLLQDVKPIKLINHRPIGNYHEIRYNKQIDQYSITPDSIFSNIVGDKENIIRLYNPGQFNFGDSIDIVLQTLDSLSNESLDTMKIVFNESSRKPSEFSYTVNYQAKAFQSNPTYQFSFNKPVISTDESRMLYQADSTYTSKPDSFKLKWNYMKTKLTLTAFINKDTLYTTYENSLPQDSILVDSVLVPPPAPSPIEFKVLSSAFYSVENDTSEENSVQHIKDITESLGTLNLNILTSSPSFVTQLLNGNQVAYQIKNNTKPTFNVAPATYSIRILIDTNNDGEWSFGNLVRGEEPEGVFLFPESISVRENWIIEDINISF